MEQQNIGADKMLVPLGFHGDGVPFQVKKTLEVFSWNIATRATSARQLLTCIEKPDVCDCGCSGRHTIDAILEVFLWSLQALLFGAWPRTRYDNQPWRREDSHRKSEAGSAFGFFAYLCEVRGDWAWFKQIFGFKGWASENIC